MRDIFFYKGKISLKEADINVVDLLSDALYQEAVGTHDAWIVSPDSILIGAAEFETDINGQDGMEAVLLANLDKLKAVDLTCVSENNGDHYFYRLLDGHLQVCGATVIPNEHWNEIGTTIHAFMEGKA